MKKTILLVGCTSKIAQRIAAAFSERYDLYGLCRNPSNAPDGIVRTVGVDLADDETIRKAAKEFDAVTFDAVIYLSSTYAVGATDARSFAKQQRHDMQVNALAAKTLVSCISLSDDSTILFFGDSYPVMPRPNMVSYSRSKQAVEALTKDMARRLAPRTKVICLRLGPVLASPTHDDKEAYYKRNIVGGRQPVHGLISFIDFLIDTRGLSMTGTLIDYDGGAYLSHH